MAYHSYQPSILWRADWFEEVLWTRRIIFSSGVILTWRLWDSTMAWSRTRKYLEIPFQTDINRFYEEIFTPRDEIVGDFTDWNCPIIDWAVFSPNVFPILLPNVFLICSPNIFPIFQKMYFHFFTKSISNLFTKYISKFFTKCIFICFTKCISNLCNVQS